MRSKHPGDILIWLDKIVESCQTHQQTITARRCIRNFERMGFDVRYLLGANILRKKLHHKRQELLTQKSK
jgi:hypothetical protein